MFAGSQTIRQIVRTVAVSSSNFRVMQSDGVLSPVSGFNKVLTFEHFALSYHKCFLAGAMFAVFKGLLSDFVG